MITNSRVLVQPEQMLCPLAPHNGAQFATRAEFGRGIIDGLSGTCS